LDVSMLSCAPLDRSASTTGTPLELDVAAPIGARPRRLAATSTIAAPCAASSRPWAIAASRSNHSPPSENESGVTLSTP